MTSKRGLSLQDCEDNNIWDGDVPSFELVREVKRKKRMKRRKMKMEMHDE